MKWNSHATTTKFRFLGRLWHVNFRVTYFPHDMEVAILIVRSKSARSIGGVQRFYFKVLRSESVVVTKYDGIATMSGRRNNSCLTLPRKNFTSTRVGIPSRRTICSSKLHWYAVLEQEYCEFRLPGYPGTGTGKIQ
eukprot:3934919-Rhodomonas_salina.1